MVCPFFGQSETTCEVGNGYISAHDAQIMSAYCCCHHEHCLRYRDLAERYPELVQYRIRQQETDPRTAPLPLATACTPITIPFRNKWPLPFRMQYLNNNFSQMFLNHKEERMSSFNPTKRGWTVALAGTGINLALGILYTWSIFKGAINDSISAGGAGAFNWNPASINDPYAVACLAFAVAMILAGKLQDKFGPKITCILGGLLVGAGFIWISQTTSYWAWIVGFGVLAGLGIGFGYSAATPPALKWFPPAKTGLIAGIVVSGFGLASVYIAPLATWMVGSVGLQQAMMYFGIGFAVVVCGLALLIVNPPADFVADPAATSAAKAAPKVADVAPRQIFKDSRFYTLWLCFFFGAGAGLMVIGSAKGMAKASMHELAFLVVVIMSVGNAAGRLVAGVISDKIGRATTLTIMLAFQAVLMFAAIFGLTANASPLFVALLVTFMVFNYGTNLALFPSFAKDCWGMKHFGMNYGILFSAWGVGAAVLVKVSELLKVKTGSFTASFAVAGVLLLVGAMMSLSLRPKKAAKTVEAPAQAPAAEQELAYQKTSR